MPTTNCAPSQITADIRNTCEKPFQQGTDDVVYCGQIRQLAGPVTRSANGTITGILLKTGEKLTRLEGFGFSTKPKQSRNKTEFGLYFPQTMDVVLFAYGQVEKNQVEALLRANDLFFIYKKRGAYGEYEEMGIDTGFEAETLGYDLAGESMGTYPVSLNNPAARRLASTVEHTTGSTVDTGTYLEGLCRAVV